MIYRDYFKHHNIFLLLSAMVLVVVIGIVDYLTGAYLTFSLFYLLPILAITWLTGAGYGLFLSCFAVIIWFFADISFREYQLHPVIAGFNALFRLIVLFIIALGTRAIKLSRERAEDLMHFIVHDLKAPLASQSISLESIKRGGPLNERQQKALARNKLSIEKMNLLINSILDLRRLEKKKLIVKTETIPVKKLAEESVNDVSGLALSRNVKLEILINVKAEEMKTDGDLVARILVNLLTNAVKFTDEGSRVVLRVLSDDNSITFKVRDQGPGIPPEIMNRVFDKYTQFNSKGRGLLRGSGLGLSFCKLAAEELGGKIYVENINNNGAQVSLTLPKEYRYPKTSKNLFAAKSVLCMFL